MSDFFQLVFGAVIQSTVPFFWYVVSDAMEEL